MCAFLKIQDISVLNWSKDIWFYFSALQKIPLLFCFESRMSEQQILVSSHTLTHNFRCLKSPSGYYLSAAWRYGHGLECIYFWESEMKMSVEISAAHYVSTGWLSIYGGCGNAHFLQEKKKYLSIANKMQTSKDELCCEFPLRHTEALCVKYQEARHRKSPSCNVSDSVVWVDAALWWTMMSARYGK